jgi:hypothetical protein
VPLQDVASGEISLLIAQYGRREPQRLVLHAFTEAARLDTFSVRAG